MIAHSTEAAALLNERLFEPDIVCSKRAQPASGTRDRLELALRQAHVLPLNRDRLRLIAPAASVTEGRRSGLRPGRPQWMRPSHRMRPQIRGPHRPARGHIRLGRLLERAGVWLARRMVTTGQPSVPPPRRLRWLPFGDPSCGRRLVKVLAWLAGIGLAGRRARAVRCRCGLMVREPVGRPHGHRVRVPRGRLVAADAADHADGARLVLHPARRLSGRARTVPAGARRLRRRRRAERLPAGQHRHVRDAADVHRDHPRREPARGLGRDAGAEDLLRARRRVRLRVPVRVRAGHVRAPVRAAARPSRPGARDRRRRRAADHRPPSHRPAQAAA